MKQFKKSELNQIIRESIQEVLSDRMMEIDAKEPDEFGEIDPSGEAMRLLGKMFEEADSRGVMVIPFSDIEDIAYSTVKDVAHAEKLAEELIENARRMSAEHGYLPDARGEFFIRRMTTQKLMKQTVPTRHEEEGEDFKGNVELHESHVLNLKKLIREEIEEINAEDEKSLEDEIRSILKVLKEHNKNYSVRKNKISGNYEVCGCSPSQIEIRPMSPNSFDVIYMKDGSDRQKKLNLEFKQVKEFVKEVLGSKSENYVTSAFNKAADQVKDVVKKTDGLPDTKQNDIKKIGDTKNDNKDYNEPEVKKKEDMPDQPLDDVKEPNKQSAHDNDSGAKYTFPKQSKDEKKHVIKGGKGKELKLPEKKIAKK